MQAEHQCQRDGDTHGNEQQAVAREFQPEHGDLPAEGIGGTITGCCCGPQPQVAAATATKMMPTVSSTCFRCVARYSGRYSVRSTRKLKAAVHTNTMGNAARKPMPALPVSGSR